MFTASPWSDEKTEELKELYAKGYSASSIAAEMGGLTRNAVCGKIHRLGLPQPTTMAHRKPKKKKEQNKKEHRTVFRIISANGNSNALRIHQSIQVERFELRCVEVEPLHISFADLAEGLCKYPFGDQPSEMTFCGLTANGSYCFHHRALCYTPALPPKRVRAAA